jgi:hypothetical protein
MSVVQYFHHRAASLNVSDIFTLACNAKRSRPSVASKAIGAVNAASKNSGEPSMIPTRTWSRIRKTQYGNLLFVLIRGFDKPEIDQPGMRGQHPRRLFPQVNQSRRFTPLATRIRCSSAIAIGYRPAFSDGFLTPHRMIQTWSSPCLTRQSSKFTATRRKAGYPVNC